MAEAVTAWTSTTEGSAAVEALQAAGIPAAVNARPSHLLADDQLWARDYFEMVDREEVGVHPHLGPVIRLHRTPATVNRPAPLYGEHTEEILKGRLGLSDDDLAQLRAEGVTSTEPEVQDWR